MESRSNSNVCEILEKITCQFDFLFRRGFRVVSILFVGARDEQWQIRLTSGRYIVQLHGDEDRVILALSSRELCDEIGFFELQELIALIEKQGNSLFLPDAPLLQVSDDFTRLAGLLEKHVDEILALMDTIQSIVPISKTRASDLNTCPGFLVICSADKRVIL